MTLVPAARKEIHQEDVAHKAGVSEYLGYKIGALANWIVQNTAPFIGKVESTLLTEAQFAALMGYEIDGVAEADKKWVRVNGQDITGSDFANLTGVTTLPNAVYYGAFPGQAKNEGDIASYEENQNKSHTHNVPIGSYGTGAQRIDKAPSDGVWSYAETTSNGGDEAKPNTFRVNYFLRINW